MNATPVVDGTENRSEATARLFELRIDADEATRAGLDDELVRLNMRLAADISRRFRGRGIPDDDLRQVAYVGLVKAVRGFAPERGFDFLSFAVPTIRGEIRRHFRDLGWAVRPPRSIQEAQTKIIACEPELAQSLGRPPRPTEIADHLGLGLGLVVESLGSTGCFAPASLDAPAQGGGEESVGQRIGYTDHAFDGAEARATLEPVLARLSKRERTIIEMRFLRGCSQSEIGAAIGVSQMHVSRLLARLMARMRVELGVEAAA